MCKLFIIGNGFDLSHQLPTTYNNFRNYLAEFAGVDVNHRNNFTLPNTYINHDGVWEIDEQRASFFLYNLLENTENIEENWEDFEAALGRLNFNIVFEENYPEVYDREGDLNCFHTSNNRENISAAINQSCTLIYDIFTEWIESIHLNNIIALENFSRIFDRNSLFLSFNYTKVLEDIYHIPAENICHIHGVIGDPLVVGHGRSNAEIENLYNYYFRRFIGAEDNLIQTIRELRKPVESRLDMIKDFSID